MTDIKKASVALIEISCEYQQAASDFPPFHFTYDGYAMLFKEVEELKAAVFWGLMGNTDEAHRIKIRADAVRVAVMALRFIVDLTEQPS